MKIIAVLFLLAFVFCTVEIATVEAGFGCPLKQKACHKHCQSVRYRGGYCEGFLKHKCKCYG
uniref:Defensin n=1 Tax=Centruroides hentzi TaxID=88313 RepID=A0A2I9LNX0_9SCOR